MLSAGRTRAAEVASRAAALEARKKQLNAEAEQNKFSLAGEADKVRDVIAQTEQQVAAQEAQAQQLEQQKALNDGQFEAVDKQKAENESRLASGQESVNSERAQLEGQIKENEVMRERRQSLAERIAHDKPLVENRVSAYWKLVLLDAQNTADSHWETVWAKALAAFTRFAVAYIDANHQVTQIQPSNPTQFANGLNPQQDSDQLRALKRQHEDLGHDEEARIARNEAAEKSLESREVQLDQQAKEFAIMIDKQTHSILQRAEELGLQMQQALAAADRARDSIKLHEDRIAQLESRSGELDALKQQQIDALPKA